MHELTSLFTPIGMKQTDLNAHDEKTAMRSLAELFHTRAMNIGDMNYNRHLASKKPYIVCKIGKPFKRFGYETPPVFFLGALLPSSQENLLRNVIDLESRRLEVPGSKFGSLLSNPTSLVEHNVLTVLGLCREPVSMTRYTVNFISAPILGEIHHTHGIEGLGSIMAPNIQ